MLGNAIDEWPKPFVRPPHDRSLDLKSGGYFVKNVCTSKGYGGGSETLQNGGFFFGQKCVHHSKVYGERKTSCQK